MSRLPRLTLPRGRLPVLPRPPRPPLPFTAVATLLLLLLPTIALLRSPRPRAEGLERLMGTASLLQSFPATPGRPVPDLWSERLGDEQAERLWRRQRQPWWQFWGPHADGAPYVALPVSLLSPAERRTLLPGGLLVEDVLVVAPDPLSRQLLEDRLQPRPRPGQGLQRRCLERLRQQQAVFWTPAAVGMIAGPVAPLLQRFQEGCLVLEVGPDGVLWQGEAAAVEGLLAGSSATATAADPQAAAPVPLPENMLLELEGGSLGQLLQGLLSRQLIREPLASRYGLEENRLRLLRSAPFRLRLRPQGEGAFQASLELQLAVGSQRPEWDAVLAKLAASLREQGLRDRPEPPGQGEPESSATESDPEPNRSAAGEPAGLTTWYREDGQVQGGWRWLGEKAGGDLLLFLGPPPADPPGLAAAAASPSPSPGRFRLRVRPEALDRLGLLPVAMPELVRRADQLWTEAAPAEGTVADQPISLLRGRLRVSR
jgi:hypothetical protein